MTSGALTVERDGKTVVIYDPLPHQRRLHESTAKYTLMEGSRGGGKSKGLRYDAYMRGLMIPRHRALIVRRSFPELRDSHLNWVPFEAEQMGFPKDAWHSTNYTLRFPNHSTLRFAQVEDDAALTKLLGSEYEWVGMDELTTFSYRQFAFLATSLRSPIPGFTPVLRAGTNPIGIGTAWVKAFFIDKNPDPEEYENYDPSDYATITCNMDDNPYVDPTNYSKMFANLPSKALREALRHGKWVVEGQMFEDWAESKDGRPWHVIDTMPTYKGKSVLSLPYIEVFRAIDWGFSVSGNPGVCLWFACLPDGSIVVFQEYVFRDTLPADVAVEIRRRSEGMKIRYTVADQAMWAEHSGPSIAEHFERAGVPMIEADRQREAGWIMVHNWLRSTINDGTGERPKLQVLRGTPDKSMGCPLLIRSLPSMVVNEKNPEDMKTKGVEDDAPDALRYGLMSRPSASKLPQADPAATWMFQQLFKSRPWGTRLGSEATHR